MNLLTSLLSLSVVGVQAAGSWSGTSMQGCLISTPDILPVPPSSIVDMSRAPIPVRTNLWIPIPRWLAGTWEADTQAYISCFEYKTRSSLIDQPVLISIRRISTRGLQIDALGQIWQHVDAPCLSMVEKTHYAEGSLLLDTQVIDSSPNSLTLRSRARVTRADKSTLKLIDEFFEETTTVYKRVRDGVIEVTFIVDDYDADGSPRTSSKSVSLELRIKPFQVVNRDQSGDLRRAFNEFQRNKQMAQP